VPVDRGKVDIADLSVMGSRPEWVGPGDSDRNRVLTGGLAFTGGASSILGTVGALS